MSRVWIISALILCGCVARTTYIQITPLPGYCAFGRDAHVPLVEAPLRVAKCRSDDGKETWYHFDTDQPTTILNNAGAAGSVIQQTGSVRSALGF